MSVAQLWEYASHAWGLYKVYDLLVIALDPHRFDVIEVAQ